MYRNSSIVRGFLVLFIMGVVTAAAASASATPPLKLPIQCHDTNRVSNAHNMSTHTGKSSWAWDFAAPRGTPVVAPADGVVSHVYQSATAECTSATGNYVVIDFGDGTSGLYAHLAPNSAYVSVGDQVQTGDLIAEVGSTGNTCGPHLHFAIQQTCGSWLCQSIQADFDFHGDPADNTYVTSHNCPATPYTPKHATSSCEVSAGEGVIIEEDGVCASQSGSGWQSKTYSAGSGEHWYATYSDDSATPSDVATWTFEAGVSGDYELFAYVPPYFTESTQATYVISDSTTTHGTVQVNQSAEEYLVSLGTFSFDAGATVTVELGNNTGETSWARVAADAMYVIHQGSSSSTPQPTPDPDPDDSTSDDSTSDDSSSDDSSSDDSTSDDSSSDDSTSDDSSSDDSTSDDSTTDDSTTDDSSSDDSTSDDSTSDDSTTDDSTSDDSTSDDSTSDDSTTDDSTSDDSTSDDSTTDDSTSDDSTSDDSDSDDSGSDDSTADEPALSVTNFTPDTVSVSSSKDVQIDGTGFQPGAHVSFSGGSGPPPRAVDVVVFDDTTIGATLLVKRGGPKRPRRWDVHVTNPDGTSVMLPDAVLIAP